MKIEQVALGTLKPYPNNPRKGNVATIAASLDTYGQYKPITVNKRNNQILAGNHTFEAAKSLKWKDISVVFVDVDETTAAKIVAIDNKASDLGYYDNDALISLLEGLPDLAGTGYDSNELDDLKASLEEMNTPDLTLETLALLEKTDGDGVKRIPTVDELAERYDARATRMIILDYQNAVYVWINQKLAEYRKQAGMESNSEAVKTLLEAHFKESAPGQ